MERIYLLLIIGFAILQVVMIVKFFQIADDVRQLKNYFVKEEKLKEAPPPTVIPDYKYEGDIVSFSDGLSGKMKQGLMGYGIGGGRYFGDKEEAVSALYMSLKRKK